MHRSPSTRPALQKPLQHRTPSIAGTLATYTAPYPHRPIGRIIPNIKTGTVAIILSILAITNPLESAQPNSKQTTGRHSAEATVPTSPHASLTSLPEQTARSMSAPLEFDTTIPVLLTEGAGDQEDIIRLAWITFRNEAEETQADLRVVYLSYPKGKWTITAQLRDDQNNILAAQSHHCENSGFISGRAAISEGDLRFSFDSSRDLTRASQFNISIAPAKESTAKSTPIISPPARPKQSGKLSLTAMVHAGSPLPTDQVDFTLWQEDQSQDLQSPDAYASAIFDQYDRIWHDTTNDITWRPVRHVSTKLDKPYTIDGLRPGRFRVTAASSPAQRTSTFTPITRSEIVTVSADAPAPEVTLHLSTQDHYPLQVRVLHAEANQPLKDVYIVLRCSDGLTVNWDGIGPAQFTDADGTERYNWLIPGLYNVEVGKHGWWTGFYFPQDNTKHTQAEVIPSQPNELTIHYTPHQNDTTR